MSEHITKNYRAYGQRAGCIAVPFVLLGALIFVGVVWYALPEAAQNAINTGDMLSYVAVVGAACVVIGFFVAPGAAATATAVDVAVNAEQFDANTESDDKFPCGEEKVTDDGIYRRVRGGWMFVRKLSDYERDERRVANNGGFTGYNSAVNEGRR